MDVRGNLDTRLRKLHETDLDGVILAAAGIKRLIGEEIITEYFEANRMVPAAGQGALGIEAREADLETETLLDAINDSHSETEVLAERTVLQELGGGCQVPIGVNARLEDDRLHLIATVCSPDGKHRILERLLGDLTCAQELGVNLATKLIQNGAHKLQSGT
jgi:hydroxymethylbilane synthase